MQLKRFGGVAIGLAPDLGLAVVATLALGLVIGPMAVTSTTLGQQHTPDALRGRTNSFNLLSAYGTVPLATVGTGLGIAAVGVTATFAVCGAISAVGALFLLRSGFRTASID